MKDVDKLIKKTNKEQLKYAYMEACSNKSFYEYLTKLNIKEEILMKYTSILQDTFSEAENCKKCKSLNTCKNKIEGYKYTPKLENQAINFSYIECPRKKEDREENQYLKNIQYYSISTDLKRSSFKDLYKDDTNRVPVLKFMQEFIKDYQAKKKIKGLYLNGSFGSGKTYLISALFNDLAKKGVKSAIVYYPEFIRDLKASFKTDYEEKFNYVKTSPLLLLDDIGAENVSNYNRDEVLGPILQYRMEENLPTFFTSNLTLEELESNLALTSSGADKVKSRRIIERIKQLTVSIELISKNRRG